MSQHTPPPNAPPPSLTRALLDLLAHLTRHPDRLGPLAPVLAQAAALTPSLALHIRSALAFAQSLPQRDPHHIAADIDAALTPLTRDALDAAASHTLHLLRHDTAFAKLADALQNGLQQLSEDPNTRAALTATLTAVASRWDALLPRLIDTLLTSTSSNTPDTSRTLHALRILDALTQRLIQHTLDHLVPAPPPKPTPPKPQNSGA